MLRLPLPMLLPALLLPLLLLVVAAIADPHDAKLASIWERSSVAGQRAAYAAGKRKALGRRTVGECLLESSIDYVSAQRNDSKTYYEASQSDNTRFHFHPLAIAFPVSSEQVSAAVKCAAQHGNTQTVARSGGHSFAGHSSGGQDGALIIDLKNMSAIHPDASKGVARIEPGARLGDVVKALWNDGKRGTAHGTCPTVGVGGHGLCGGFGPTSRKWGMMVDNMVEAQVVLADGSMVRASQNENSELWWGLRGAGSFFGIVTEYTLQTYKADTPMTFMEYRWTKSLRSVLDAVELMHAIQIFASLPSIPSELGFHVQAQQPGSDDPPGGTLAVHMRGLYMGPVDELRRNVLPGLWDEIKRRGLSDAKPDAVVERETSYLHVMEDWDDFGKPGDKLDTLAERMRRNNFVQRTSLAMGQKGFSKAGFRSILDGLWQWAVERERAAAVLKTQSSSTSSNRKKQIDKDEYWVWNIYFEFYGGQHNRLRDADLTRASSLVHRDALWLIQSSVGSFANVPLLHAAYAFLHKLDTSVITALQRDGIERRSFRCYADATLKDWKHLYYSTALPRLEALKRSVDPTNLFRTPQSLIDTPRADSSGAALTKDPDWSAHVHPLP